MGENVIGKVEANGFLCDSIPHCPIGNYRRNQSIKYYQKEEVIKMRGTTKIKNLGIVNLDGVSIGNGQIEVHVPIADAAEQLDKVIDECTIRYMACHKNVKLNEELNFDVRVVFSCGGFRLSNKDEAEFNLLIIVWQKSDHETGKDTTEFYEEIPVSFNDSDSKRIKKIIWDGLGEALFNL